MELLNPTLFPVDPVKPPAPWLGGKKILAGEISAVLERVEHHCYAEPFLGMGGVFFRRRYRPKAEVINDINADVVTLFRILQRHYASFISELKFSLTSRSRFEQLTKTDPSTLTDIERAARFLYLQRTAFSGKVVGQNFGTSTTTPAKFNLTEIEPMLADLHERLAGVVIERLPYGDFIERYDRADTLFYLDPPYFDCENDYGRGVFARADFARLAAQLAKVSGKFVLSINDRPEIREIFKAFALAEVEATYSAAGGDNQIVAAELLISNLGAR